MKKSLLLGALFATSAVLSAQTQIANSNFEDWRSANEATSWNSFASAKVPSGLSGIFINIGKTTMTPSTTSVEGRTGKAAQIVSINITGNKANGNLTTGRINMGSTTPSDKANHNFTDVTSAAHNRPFSGQPDSVAFYAKYKRGESKDYNGQATFILHNKSAYKNPYETAANVAKYRVAEAIVPITPATEWTRFAMPLIYSGVELNADGGYMLASFTTNPTPGGSAGDTLRIDDVAFIYNSRLRTLAYDGNAVEGFSPDSTVYTISALYDPSKLTLEANGRSAKVTTAYSEADSTLTIRVEGGNIADDATNSHTYTLRFAPVADIPTSIATATTTAELTDVYTLTGQRVRRAVLTTTATEGLPNGIYLVGGQKVVVQ